MKIFGIELGQRNSLKDKLYWLLTGFMTKMGMIAWGGGSPSPAPTTSTSYTTNIPDYAQPYVSNMLNAAQAQIYNPSMTGFNPYTPYSTDPSNYVAGPSPMQQQSYSTAANMQVPGQYGLASAGTLGTSMGLGALGNQMGQAGNQYANQATNPYATQAYMNPYLQASLAPQLQLANQQYGIAGQQEQSNAATSGAFGGSREALMNGLNQQNQMLAQNQIIGQGYNTAFNNAQQAQQFGANLGLQGQQSQAQSLASQLAAYNQLAGLGGQQLAAQQGIANQQNTFGQQQQTQQQNIINQAVQNYATAQQYPFMQLGLLNSMLRGLPMQQSSTQMYQAPPNALSTIAGLGATAYGLSKKDGGVIKASGGIPLDMYTKTELNSPYLSTIGKVVGQGIQQVDDRIQSNPEAKKVFAQPLQMQSPQVPPSPQQMAMMPQNRIGLNTIGTNDMTQMAGGGIIAFADTGAVPPATDPAVDQNADWFTVNPQSKQKEFDIDKFMIANAKPGPSVSESIQSDIQAQRDALAEAKQGREKDKWLSAGSALLSNTSPFWQVGLGSGLNAYNQASSEAAKDIASKQSDIIKSELLASEKDQAAKDRMIGLGIAANTAQENAKIRALTAQNLAGQLKNDKDAKEAEAAQRLFDGQFKDNLANAVKDNANAMTPKTMDEMKSEAYNTSYAFMGKSKLGQKHLNFLPTPDDFKLTLPSYMPKAPGDENVPAVKPESHWYDIFGGGSSSTPAVRGVYDPATQTMKTIH